MAYESIILKRELDITSVVSIHYFEYMNTFSYEGESHDFWEFLCVDKGAVDVVADDIPHSLEKDRLSFINRMNFTKYRPMGTQHPIWL